jgi:hypothetical protein
MTRVIAPGKVCPFNVDFSLLSNGRAKGNLWACNIVSGGENRELFYERSKTLINEK